MVMSSVILKNIKKTYDNKKTVINNVNLEIKDKEFVTQKTRNISSRSVDVAFRKWLEDLSFEDRKEFVEKIFSVFEDAGIKNSDDLTSEGFSTMKSVFFKMRNLDAETSGMMRSFFRTLMFASMNEVKKTALNFYNNVIETIRSKAPQDE